MDEKVDEEINEENVEMDDKVQKKRNRKRRKGFAKKIKKQIEFYLSDANLRKDRYTRELMKKNGPENEPGVGYIDLVDFLNYNLIKSLTKDIKDIRTALRTSELIEFNEDETKIKRKYPIDESKDIDSCTVYIERLPPHADHKWIQNTFNIYGVIVYISLPRFKNKKIKGYCFIEFENKESVVKVCEHFGANLPSNANNGDNNKDDQHPIAMLSDDENDESYENESNKILEKDTNLKRSLLNDSNEEIEDRKRRKITNDENVDNDSHESDVDNEESMKTVDQQLNINSKVNRRKEKKINEMKSVQQEIEKINLRVLSKYEWLEYKKKYLELQRENFDKLKKATKQLSLGNDKEQSSNDKSEYNMDDSEKGKIIKLLIKTCIDKEFVESLFKKQLRDVFNDKLAYIDLIKDKLKFVDEKREMKCFLRFKTKEDAENVTNENMLAKLPFDASVIALEDNEENEYWQRVNQCREKKRLNKEMKAQRASNRKLEN